MLSAVLILVGFFVIAQSAKASPINIVDGSIRVGNRTWFQGGNVSVTVNGNLFRFVRSATDSYSVEYFEIIMQVSNVNYSVNFNVKKIGDFDIVS